MQDEMREAVARALVILARYNVPPDVQDLLVNGDGRGNVRPGALAAALSSPSAGTVRVKKLEWKTFRDGGGYVSFESHSLIGLYSVWRSLADSPVRWSVNSEKYTAESIEAAKAAAQTDFDHRILSALESGDEGGRHEMV